MASISKRVSKTGITKWQVIIRKPGCATIVETCPTREAADAFVQQTERAHARSLRKQHDPCSTLPPTGDLADEKLVTTMSLFAQSGKLRASHALKIAMLKKHFKESEPVLIRDLDDDWVREFVAAMTKRASSRGQPYAESTAVGLVSFLNTVIKWRAHELKREKPYFVVSSDALPAGWNKRRTRRLEPDEERAILRRMRSKAKRSRKSVRNRLLAYQYRLMFRLALETAARLQELVLAQWSEISKCPSVWDIPATHTKCKTARTVPLSPTASRILRVLWRMRDPNAPRIFHLVKTPGDASDWFKNTFRSAKVLDFRFHDCRHEAIARFVLHPDCYPVPKLMKIVGHKDYAMFDRYITFRDVELAGFMKRK